MRMIPPPSEIRTDLLTLGFEQSNWAADILTDLKLWATSKLLRISIDFPQAKYCCSHFYIDLQPSSDPKTSTLNCFCPAGLNYSRSSRNQTSFRSISHCFLLSVIGTRSYLYFYLLFLKGSQGQKRFSFCPHVRGNNSISTLRLIALFIWWRHGLHKWSRSGLKSWVGLSGK